MKMIRTATMVAMICMPASALGQTAACGEIDATIQRANAMRQAGRDADAVALLRPLLACGPNPRLRATLGLAELAAALWVQGFQHLSSALGATGDAWVTSRRATLQAALDQSRIHVGYLEVSANVPRAELRIGGEMVATLPMSGPTRVAAGTLTYELAADGYVSELRRVEVAGNDALTREHVLLTPRPREVATAAATSTPAVRPALVIDPPVRGSSPPGSGMRAAGWATLATSVVLLGGGIAASLVQGSADSYLIDGTNNCRGSAEELMGECLDRYNTRDTAFTLSLIGYVGGGALAVTSLVLFLVAPSETRGSARTVSSCGVGPGTAGVTCAFAF